MQESGLWVSKSFIGLIVILLAVYLWLSVIGIEETRDAEVIESVQVNLQATVSKGMTALQLPPSKIHPLNIVNAAKSSFPKGVKVDEKLNLHIVKTDRGAQFRINDSGDLMIVSLKNFTRYHVENGRIVRNNHWPPMQFAPLLSINQYLFYSF